MMNQQDLQGIYVPVITPFLPNGELDPDSYRTYVGKLLAHNIQGLVINGTTGESPTVTWEEVTALTMATKAQMQGASVPVVIGTGTNDTAATVKQTEMAAQLGADGVLVVVPYYSRPSQEGIIEHFRRVAQVGIPVIVYEIPARTGVRLTVDTARTIMEMDGVIGMKDSSGGTELVSALSRLASKPVLCGEDVYFYDALRAGAAGGIMASASVNTDSFREVYRLAAKGMFEEAGTAFERLLPLIRLLFQESNPTPLKWLLARQGIIAGDTVRLPLTSISRGLADTLERFLFSHECT
ncbi:4-hydroxy-tetrahydrodipicolinate synthase [Paenibacillus allorhizosphaerae]|uniref:4-hydroxy-tetrahydrodipicolinate synthase n=1 Tax=Paenibacillus allorhizosphaerae TaxID=2849866 RepID=A0ABM8VE83_9BACL|nr:4-hydroxy-tetrahydrodipicolinate synthase [Paenibacillus allorhizosphaerae]CAG7630327.1 4-hydroxy-tetrahydrodipicolinate synthase [Paenibacillus allorhizosphaerae]